MKINLEDTISICPKCHKQIKAKILDKFGSTYMEKFCDEHGYFEAKIARYAWYYKGLNDFYNKLYPNRNCFGLSSISDYQFFPRINSKLIYDVFFTNFDKPTVDISLREFKDMIGNIKGPKGRIIMFGGEPTTRSDLPDFIKIASEEGYRPWIYSNGFMLDEQKYLKKLKNSGLVFTWLWMDALNDESIYEKIRGSKFDFDKKKILGSFKILNMPIGIIVTVVKGINESEIEHFLRLARGNNFIKALVIKTYSHIGQKKFLPEAEFTMDELVELISHNGNLITLEEFYVFQKMAYVLLSFTKNPLCYLKQFIYLPRKENKKLRDIIDLRKFEPSLDKFAEIYKESPLSAKIYFLKEIFKKCIQNPLFLFLLGCQKFPLCNSYFLRLDVSSYYTELNYDLNKIKRRCNDVWLPSLIDGKPTDFCGTLINSFWI